MLERPAPVVVWGYPRPYAIHFCSSICRCNAILRILWGRRSLPGTRCLPPAIRFRLSIILYFLKEITIQINEVGCDCLPEIFDPDVSSADGGRGTVRRRRTCRTGSNPNDAKWRGIWNGGMRRKHPCVGATDSRAVSPLYISRRWASISDKSENVFQAPDVVIQ